MAFGESLLDVDPVTGVVVGIGAILLWPLASRVGRPLAKEVIKSGIRLYRAGERVATAIKDISVEAEAETKHGAEPPHAVASSA